MAEIDERYEILEELGRGARGVVYKARDKRIGRLVALKAIRPEPGLSVEEEGEFFQRFHREALTAGNLTHPNIVTIYDIYEDPVQRTSYISMEYIRGQSLQQLIDDGRVFSLEEAIKMAIQVAAGLDFAHRRGVIHRDIKPANLILDTEERLIITDFSVARIASSDLTRDGQFMGTPSFIAPEQITGGAVGPRSDIFSLAVVFYQLLTAERPFIGDNISTVLYKIVHRDPPPPSLLNKAVTPDTDAVVAMGLQKNPDQRYQEASWMKEDLVSLIRRQTPLHAVGLNGGKDREPDSAMALLPPVRDERLTRTAQSLAIMITALQRAFHILFRVDLLARLPRWVRKLERRARWATATACCLLLATVIFSWTWFGNAGSASRASLLPDNPLIESVRRPSDVWFDESRYLDGGPGGISFASMEGPWREFVTGREEAEALAEEAARQARARKKTEAEKPGPAAENTAVVEVENQPAIPPAPPVTRAANIPPEPPGTLELVLHHSFSQGTVTVKAGGKVLFSSAIGEVAEEEPAKGNKTLQNLKRRFRQEVSTFSGIPVPSGHNQLEVFLEVPGKEIVPVELGVAFDPDEMRRLHLTYGRLKGKKVTTRWDSVF
jgi:predicted Ser/Thr protein kinase